MKRRVALFCAVSFMSLGFVLPAEAGTIYDNGPINGNTDAWTINFGFEVSDSFTVSGGASTVTGLSFGAWITPGDTVTSVEVFLSSEEGGGTSYFDQQVSLVQSSCVLNQFSFDVCRETGNFNGPQLGNGTYWLNLQNATDTNGDPVYWDENSGPSLASEGGEGTLPSEAFTISGNNNGSTPEPGSLLLLASGVLGVAGVLRRKLR